jgi:hypothetical protein
VKIKLGRTFVTPYEKAERYMRKYSANPGHFRHPELENVMLKNPIPDHALPKGTTGTVVDALHADQGWVTVEFFRGDDSVAVLPVKIENPAPLKAGDEPKKRDR